MADPRQTLQDLIRRFGTSLAEEPQRCKGMLMDLCGSSRREIAGLVVAIEEKITTELMKPHPIVVSLRANMILRLENNRGLAPDIAMWTVDTWGLVLGTWTQADLDSFPPMRGYSSGPPQPQPRQAQWNIDQVPLESEKRANYTRLRDLLKAQKWKEADRETYRLMITIVGRKEGDYCRQADLLNFPCKDLKTIDRLWVQASQGRYGFSVQKEIYVRCGGKLDGEYPGNKIWH